MGFEDFRITYTVFYSQGDGLHFTCKNINLGKLLAIINFNISEKEKKLIINFYNNDYYGISITKKHTDYAYRYDRKNTVELVISHTLFKYIEKFIKLLKLNGNKNSTINAELTCLNVCLN